MKLGSAPGIGRAFSTVVEHFPDRELAIRRLLQCDEVFREMCEELSDAKAALARYSRPDDEVLEAIRAEWHDLVGRLVAELMTMLNAHDASLQKDRA